MIIIDIPLKLLERIKIVAKKSLLIIIGKAIKAFNLEIIEAIKRGVKEGVKKGIKEGIKKGAKRDIKGAIKRGRKRDNNYYK